jgi:hypothetical protein
MHMPDHPHNKVGQKCISYCPYFSFTSAVNHRPRTCLPQSSGLAFGFEQAEDVVFPDCSQTLINRWPLLGFESLMNARSDDIPGPFTFRMMDRVWSSMNSTRTWVTPPREPANKSVIAKGLGCVLGFCDGGRRTCSAEDAGDLDKLDWLFSGIHCYEC